MNNANAKKKTTVLNDLFLSHCLVQCRDNGDYCIPCIHTIYAMLSSGMLLLVRTSTILLSRTSFNANKRFSLVMLPLLGGWVLSRIWLTSTVISSWAGKTQEGKRLDNTYMYVRCYCDFLHGLYIAQSQCLDAIRFWWRFSKRTFTCFLDQHRSTYIPPRMREPDCKRDFNRSVSSTRAS